MDSAVIGIPVAESAAVPPGTIVRVEKSLFVSSRGVDLWRLKHQGRDPFLSRFGAHARELRRERKMRR